MIEIKTNNHYSTAKYAHEVILKDGFLSKLFDTNKILVNSYHNYCVDDTLSEIIKDYSSDGVIEALEIPGYSFGIGVQWHPELITDDENSNKIFNRFVDAAEEYSYKKRKKTR